MSDVPAIQMLSNRSYLLRAFYDWIVDSGCTPYMVVLTENHNVQVPQQFIEHGKVVLNVSPQATREFTIENKGVTFLARFSGVTREIYAPLASVSAIYAIENGRGMVFEEEDFIENSFDNAPKTSAADKKRAHLRVIKGDKG
jgi:stringent starvation protein B